MKELKFIGGILFLAAVVLTAYFIQRSQKGSKVEPSKSNLPVVTEINKFEEKVSDEGMVIVRVSPKSVSKGSSEWLFDVVMDTHVKNLSEDMVKVSFLLDSKGQQQGAISWEGDSPGSHHRTGVLKFRPISPYPDVITLTINQVGGVSERKFVWAV